MPKLKKTTVATLVVAVVAGILVPIATSQPAAAQDPPFSDSFTPVSAGNKHSCAVSSSGTVTCWGETDDGRSDAPSGQFTSVSAGNYHSCGLRKSGTVTCWGDNSDGRSDAPSGQFKAVSASGGHVCAVRLDGTATCWGYNDAGRATAPSGQFTAVSAGGAHSCGLRSNGNVKCWGENYDFQSDPPANLSPFIAVSAGSWHSCAVRSNGTVICWGENEDGQTDAPSGEFTAVSAGGAHSCGLRRSGTVICWGDNDDEQSDAPSGQFTAVSAGRRHSCAVRSDGTVTCWGNNADGQARPPAGLAVARGDSEPPPTTTTQPQSVEPSPFNDSFTPISAGWLHSCAVRSSGTVTCWGDNTNGRASAPSGQFAAVSAGNGHSCGLRSNGTVFCWGDNNYGRASAPSGQFTAVSAGNDHSCAVRSDGRVACWGDNDYSQRSAPSGQFAAVSAGWFHSCGLRNSGTIACWGNNTHGEASAPSGQFTAVSAGGLHSCGLRSNGTVTCWGDDSKDQVSAVPTGQFTAVSAGSWHSCAVRRSGTVICWGDNDDDQSDAPSGKFTAVSAGNEHSCGLRNDGTIDCWGDSSLGKTNPPANLKGSTTPIRLQPGEPGTKENGNNGNSGQEHYRNEKYGNTDQGEPDNEDFQQPQGTVKIGFGLWPVGEERRHNAGCQVQNLDPCRYLDITAEGLKPGKHRLHCEAKAGPNFLYPRWRPPFIYRFSEDGQRIIYPDHLVRTFTTYDVSPNWRSIFACASDWPPGMLVSAVVDGVRSNWLEIPSKRAQMLSQCHSKDIYKDADGLYIPRGGTTSVRSKYGFFADKLGPGEFPSEKVPRAESVRVDGDNVILDNPREIATYYMGDVQGQFSFQVGIERKKKASDGFWWDRNDSSEWLIYHQPHGRDICSLVGSVRLKNNFPIQDGENFYPALGKSPKFEFDGSVMIVLKPTNRHRVPVTSVLLEHIDVLSEHRNLATVLCLDLYAAGIDKEELSKDSSYNLVNEENGKTSRFVLDAALGTAGFAAGALVAGPAGLIVGGTVLLASVVIAGVRVQFDSTWEQRRDKAELNREACVTFENGPDRYETSIWRFWDRKVVKKRIGYGSPSLGVPEMIAALSAKELTLRLKGGQTQCSPKRRIAYKTIKNESACRERNTFPHGRWF